MFGQQMAAFRQRPEPLDPVCIYADLTPPTEDEVPTATLNIASVTYP